MKSTLEPEDMVFDAACPAKNCLLGRVPGGRKRGGTVKSTLEPEDICGLCGKPGADKYAHHVYWPGERVPVGPLVHATCESEECQRAHSELNDNQRRSFLSSIK